MTFQTLQAKQDFVDRGDFDVGIQRAVVAGVTIRVHWTPYFVPMVAIVDQFRHLTGIKVLNARFETTKIGNREWPHEIRTLVRYITVEATTTLWVLHLIQWRHGGASGQALVTMAGRPGVCLRCLSPSHFRRDCRATFCGNCRKWGQHDARECTVRPTWASTTAPMRSAAEMDDLNEEDEDPDARREFDERRRAFLDRFSVPPDLNRLVAAKKAAAAVVTDGSPPSTNRAPSDAAHTGDLADVSDAEMLAAVAVGAGGGPPVGAFATSTLAAVSTVIGEDDVVPIGIANCGSFPHLFPISGGTNVFVLAIIFIIIFPVWASVVIAFSCSFCCMCGTRVLCWREGTCFPDIILV